MNTLKEIKEKQSMADASMVIDSGSPIVTGLKKDLIILRVWLSIALKVFVAYPKPWLLLKVIKKLKGVKNEFSNDRPLKKIVVVNGRSYISFNSQGFPSPHFYRN